MNFQIKRSIIIRKYWIYIFFFQFIYGADDTELWSSVGFEKNLPYSFNIELEQELRLKDQFSSFKQTISEVSLSYDLYDGLKVFIPIRYAIFQDKTKERLGIGGSYKYDFKPISFKYRMKLQRTYENKQFPIDLIRNKFSIEYKINKTFKPYISSEIFHLQNLNQYEYDEYRISFGVNVDLPRKKGIKIFYIYKLEDITKSNQEQINSFGVSYHFK